jgi:hypothetical protein
VPSMALALRSSCTTSSFAVAFASISFVFKIEIRDLVKQVRLYIFL